jgi:hypothetical protein
LWLRQFVLDVEVELLSVGRAFARPTEFLEGSGIVRAIVPTLLLLSFASLALPVRANSGSIPIDGDVVVAIDIEGTVWSGVDSMGDAYTFRYLKGGVLNYTSPTGTYQNGTWKQHEGKVYMEMNGRYAEYRGVLQGESIVGEAGNRAGLHWGWRVKQTKKGGK